MTKSDTIFIVLSALGLLAIAIIGAFAIHYAYQRRNEYVSDRDFLQSFRMTGLIPAIPIQTVTEVTEQTTALPV